ncbi:sigma-70 family RNA polymerase sigma factor [Flammeovirga sp. EKP202]|uniref:sigma-70 family RNA polymerase sigma factor n=1 Tax=Flammeovirga sp. EKP202 TaxID=2770592 RepID=UPI00165FABA9|nr:sigma-70 family RNA polymerase sigma factor [Flammeovirga sp. EKP202]MBD0402340.1 sigma-70 family RNA polymerase sigma factor [Flammeovirga sp. EKP202]
MSFFSTQSSLSSKDIVHFVSQNIHLKKCVRTLYKENYTLVEVMVLKMYGTKLDAEDVFRYALSKVIWLIQEGKIDDEIELRTYIYTLSRKLWVNTLKKKNNYTYYTSDSYHENFNAQLLEDIPFKEDDLYLHKEFSETYKNCKPLEKRMLINKLFQYWKTKTSSSLPKMSV